MSEHISDDKLTEWKSNANAGLFLYVGGPRAGGDVVLALIDEVRRLREIHALDTDGLRRRRKRALKDYEELKILRSRVAELEALLEEANDMLENLGVKPYLLKGEEQCESES